MGMTEYGNKPGILSQEEQIVLQNAFFERSRSSSVIPLDKLVRIKVADSHTLKGLVRLGCMATI